MKEINEKNQRLGASLSSSMTELRSASKEIRDVETVMINDIIDEIISASIEKSGLQNVTIQSLAISLDLNKIFEYYSRGYYTSGSKMNMSGYNMMSEMHSQNTPSTSISTTTHNNKTINDMHSYNRGLSSPMKLSTGLTMN